MSKCGFTPKEREERLGGMGGGSSAIVAWYHESTGEITVNGEVPSAEQWFAWAKAKTPVFFTNNTPVAEIVGGGYNATLTPAGWSAIRACGAPVLKLEFIAEGDEGYLVKDSVRVCDLPAAENLFELLAAWGDHTAIV